RLRLRNGKYLLRLRCAYTLPRLRKRSLPQWQALFLKVFPGWYKGFYENHQALPDKWPLPAVLPYIRIHGRSLFRLQDLLPGYGFHVWPPAPVFWEKYMKSFPGLSLSVCLRYPGSLFPEDFPFGKRQYCWYLLRYQYLLRFLFSPQKSYLCLRLWLTVQTPDPALP